MNGGLIDLHIHTSLSDGTDTPEQIIDTARKIGVDIISITDHNSVEAYRLLRNSEALKCFPGRLVDMKELWKHPENLARLPDEVVKHPELLIRFMTNPDSPFYVEPEYPSVFDVIKAIHDAGGLAFLAHPFIYPTKDPCELVKQIILSTDLDGVEVFYSLHNLEQTLRMLKLVEECGVYASGGSDYHGSVKAGIKMAAGQGDLIVPSDLIGKWLFFA